MPLVTRISPDWDIHAMNIKTELVHSNAEWQSFLQLHAAESDKHIGFSHYPAIKRINLLPVWI